MIELPDFDRAFEYEDGFYLSCDITRISKIRKFPFCMTPCYVVKG